jgi:hypothetical protein
VGAEVASAFLSTSGAIYDTRPVTSQEAGWFFDLGDYGWIDGYFWIISSLTDKKHDTHRMLFHEIESVVRYGRTWRTSEDTAFKAGIGPTWKPTLGHDDPANNWGSYFIMQFDNPVVVPYVKGIWIFEPRRHGRIRFGLEKSISLSESLSLTPMVETVWMDRLRYTSRYGDDPENPILGGSFATVTSGAKLSWRVTENFQAYLRLLMFDIVDAQARRAVKRQDAYYAKCDWPVLKVGVRYSF